MSEIKIMTADEISSNLLATGRLVKNKTLASSDYPKVANVEYIPLKGKGGLLELLQQIPFETLVWFENDEGHRYQDYTQVQEVLEWVDDMEEQIKSQIEGEGKDE